MDKIGNAQVRITTPSRLGGSYAVSVRVGVDGKPRITRAVSSDFLEAYWAALAEYLGTDEQGAKELTNFPE